jgi:hypothetical protein
LTKGKIMYVPAGFFLYLDGIKKEKGIKKNSEIWYEATKALNYGLEIQRAAKLDFSKAPKIPALDTLFPEVRRRKKWR